MIYFIEDPATNRVKIGTTIRLSVRLAQLRAKHGPGLQVLGVTGGSYADERVLHDRFQLLREDGEWFKAHEILTDFIERETQPWDGTDEAPALPSIKLDAEVVRKARIVVDFRDSTLGDYLSNLLRPIVEADYRKHIEESHKEIQDKPTTKPKGGKG